MVSRPPEKMLATTTKVSSGISLRDVVYVIFRRRWIILAICLPIIAVGGGSLFQQSGSFTAASRVVVELSKVDLPKWDPTKQNVDYDRELSTLFNIAMSVPVAEVAAAAMRDSIEVIKTLDPNLVWLNEKYALRDYLLEGLDVSVVGESSILEFRFTSPHPRISLMATGAMRDAFVEFQVFGRKNLQAVAFYEEQISAVRTEIDSLLSRRGKILSENNYSSLENELRYDSGILANLESELNSAMTNRRSLGVEVEWVSSYLDGDPRDFPMGPDENRSNTLVYWRNLVGKHDDELNSILTVHTEESAVTIRQKQLVQSSVENLSREQRNYVKSLEITFQSAKETEESIRDRISRIQKKNSRAPDVYQQVSLLDTEIESLRDLLSDIQGKRGEVRLNQLADERVSSVAILSDPELLAILSSGKTVIYFIMIIVMAIALGIVAAFILESQDHRIYTPKDVEANLNLPVFASVTRMD